MSGRHPAAPGKQHPRCCRRLKLHRASVYTVIVLLTMPGAWRFSITLSVIEMALSCHY
jgi:hypothetical protein